MKRQERLTHNIFLFGFGFKFLGRAKFHESEHDKDAEQKYIWNGELEYLVPYATISTEESTSPGSVSSTEKGVRVSKRYKIQFAYVIRPQVFLFHHGFD